MLLGLVGKPSVGKSTFFKASTLAEVPIASYPFTTIKANHGIAYVKVDCLEKEFNTKCNPSHGFCLNGNRFVPIEMMDVAGLVPGASEGKGLGNQFLDDLRQADSFIHIVDLSGKTNAEGKPLEKNQEYSVIDDVNFLENELDTWYYNIFMKVWKSFARKIEMENKKFSEAVANQFSGLKISEELVKEVLLNLNLPEKPTSWNEKQIKEFIKDLRHKSKPSIIAANKIDTEKGEQNYKILKEKFPDLLIIPCSADSELALREAAKEDLIDYIPGEKEFKITFKGQEKLNEKQKQALEKIKKNVLEKYEFGTGIQKVLNTAIFDLLKYLAVFPASANKLSDSKGNILPDCFLMPLGSTALDFAYKVHKDIGDKFIRAINAKTKQTVGKDYKLQHRDGLEIISR
ncbi:MAG: redox-regulated ATPase YchF [Nanoarchaeota archaeon]